MMEVPQLMISTEEGPLTKRLSLEIEKVEENMTNVKQITREAIDSLNAKKKQLREQSDPNVKYSKDSEEEIEKQITEIAEQEQYILKELSEKHADFTERKISIDKLNQALVEMDREIRRIQAEHDAALLELEQKKNALRQKIVSLEKLDLLINVLTYKIYEARHDYRSSMEALIKEREMLLKRTDLTKSQMALALAALEQKIADNQNRHASAVANLEGKRSELQKETVLKSEFMDVTMDELKQQHDNMLKELERQKIGASPSQIEEINKRIAELNRAYGKEVEGFSRLQEQGWKKLSPEEKLSGLLETRGLRATVSGNFLTSSGRHLTRSEASRLGLFEEVEFGSWGALIEAQQEYERGTPEGSSTTLEGSSASRMSHEDTNYLKTTLGKPLTLALAEITAKQPRDPIHYLGHWLLKYRYNQEVDEVKKQEIQDLMNERDLLEKEKIHQMIKEEAEKVVLDLVIRTEALAIRNELERIARESAMLEEENGLDAEARDVLGVYNGPPIGAT